MKKIASWFLGTTLKQPEEAMALGERSDLVGLVGHVSQWTLFRVSISGLCSI